MRYLLFLPFSLFVCSCSSMPQFFQAAEQIATDTAVKVEVSREVITPDTDLKVDIELINRTVKK